ncbi:MAG: hypothetical protein ACREA0_23440, partial [bacterium]
WKIETLRDGLWVMADGPAMPREEEEKARLSAFKMFGQFRAKLRSQEKLTRQEREALATILENVENILRDMGSEEAAA